MLKPKAIAEILQQTVTGGVTSSLLFSPDGSLLAYAGTENQPVTVCAAIASSIWTFYEGHTSSILEQDNLQTISMDCEEGKIVIKPVSNLLLCLVGNETTQFGMLRTKIAALSRHIEKPLKRLEGFA
ncbi:Ragulator complex protein lamtor2 [Entomophthora muscae]|uniref:Ragulator complex protein lamtor2 n=1 Tax=Entomophthora muscae TaxID=34485 RepID=A0ACC2SSR5_9FUNG|nr:Ragulator complex protein lamtor2 [Entomophthora muscae]